MNLSYYDFLIVIGYFVILIIIGFFRIQKSKISQIDGYHNQKQESEIINGMWENIGRTLTRDEPTLSKKFNIGFDRIYERRRLFYFLF